MEKNASLRFVWAPEDYEKIDFSIGCNEDLTFSELVDYFKHFATAMGYSQETINKLENDD